MKKEFIECKIPIKFPLEANNNICFTKESLKNVVEDLKNAPIVNKDDIPIGILTDKFNVIESEKEMILHANGWLFVECFPEIIINKVEKIDGVNIVTDFNFSAISIEIKTKE